MTTIRLQSSDGEIFTVDVEVAQYSVTLTNLMNRGIGLGENDVIPLATVNSRNLTKVLEYYEHHRNDPVTEPIHRRPRRKCPPRRRSNNISKWDQRFLDIDNGALCELALAAYCLELSKLLNVICSTFANRLKRRTPEEKEEVMKFLRGEGFDME
ncbi:S-phase kinase-associated protein 1-like [Toxorhynchites rutilus septentrionalis]|uniref:S-phase kinase-associated protein 1-like n=1 Tax=Toxorhynchites rutilus septentrionalis TaxID=329112 RepID=UPI0024798A85|nr:S-phase kinase-associated protein 1-like [Toxorhynchites rutilus septentrionalis]